MRGILVVMFRIVVLTGLLQSPISGQHFTHPYVHSKSHETLTLDSVVVESGLLSFFLRVENKIDGGGWFCASKHIEVVDDSTDRRWLVSSTEGIPTCPEAHKFNRAGEQLSFVLRAPVPLPVPPSISIYERCVTGCISMEGIVLDPVFAEELKEFDRAVFAYRSGKLEEAQVLFDRIYSRSEYRSAKHFGYVLYIRPRIAYERKQSDTARQYYRQLLEAPHPDADVFVDRLNSIPFFRVLSSKGE